MQAFIKLFKKVGGAEILRQYWQAHVLLYAMIVTPVMGFSKKSLEIVRLAMSNKILKKLRRKYCAFIEEWKKTASLGERTHADKVWMFWSQGIENAPHIVQCCVRSLQNNLKDREIILLTEQNYKDYVQFPDHVQRKIDSGIITKTHMSDLLRLELLNRYGGTWIDATVFCSGEEIPDYMLNSDLFFFQTLKPGLDGQCTCMSSWFMTASAQNPVLMLTQALLYDYWKNHTKMMDYFLLHDFFELALEAYPEEKQKVIPFSSSMPHILLLRLFDSYDESLWHSVQKMTPIHKLSYKFTEQQANLPGTYYDVLFGKSSEQSPE